MVEVYEYRSIGNARTAGADVSVRFDAAEWLSATAAYSYLWTQDDARLPLGLHLAAQFKAISSSRGFESSAGDQQAPGFSLLGARVALPLWPSLEAYSGAQNLGDVRRAPGDAADLRPILGSTIYFGFAGEVPGEEP